MRPALSGDWSEGPFQGGGVVGGWGFGLPGGMGGQQQDVARVVGCMGVWACTPV